MTTKILGNQITNYTIDTQQLSNTATAAFAKTLAPKVLYANVANSLYYTLDDTAVNVGGGYIVVTGAEFQSGATVLIDTTPASAVTYVNSTTLQVQVPTKSAASYNLYVVNPDGGVGIKVSGITYSSEPTWVTASPLANQAANTAFGVNLSATGATSYSVAAGSTLPAGTTLAANGYFSGTVSIGAETTYSFSVVATDAELQDSSKTFQVTVTVTPVARLFVSGKNNLGQLGLNLSGTGGTNYASSPTQIGSQTTWLVGSAGYNVSLGIKTDGTLWTWGSSASGALGINVGNGNPRSSPTQVGSGTTWLTGCVGFYTGLAIKTDGTLWAWGQQDFGQTGLNSAGANTYKSSPTQVGAATNWSKVSGANYHSLFIKTDGTLWGTGYNLTGALGLNDRVNKSSPTQIGAGTNWLSVAGGAYHSLAIKTDGTLWAWGQNTNGRLGLNDIVWRSSPTQVGTGTDWNLVTASRYHTAAIKTDGTLWSWGRNHQGQLGVNSGVEASSPVQVASSTNWSKLSTTSGWTDSVMAIKTDGTLWAWGKNPDGQLGTGDKISRSSPVQVGSATNWDKISVGVNHNFIITR